MPPKPSSPGSPVPQKRKEPPSADQPSKRPRSQPPSSTTTSKSTLIPPHEAIIAELQPKYHVLAASVISSTQIRKRVSQTLAHLNSASDQPNVVLLHSRTGEVCKMITIVEQCKRLLKEEGKTWFQYNEMFEVPERERKDVVEETVLEKDGEDEDPDGDDFEVMASRFEEAVMPEPSRRVVKSLRVFLSVGEVGDLKNRKGVTVQSSEGA
ncbi:alba domain-containing protein [Pochonia chlamydosporia 170]|uniref:Alba domain-containing protein n=1 Tax=Pochonia chlamydosporia 170 TaxID=1380566 RepID=A0A179F920_METCM|nr:alba domain-containing protein [Pochonia chlamydosporia 170]OAQ61946.1 alba domain-containing protein [Pochonia chlamydosporia 170]